MRIDFVIIDNNKEPDTSQIPEEYRARVKSISYDANNDCYVVEFEPSVHAEILSKKTKELENAIVELSMFLGGASDV